MFDNNLNDDASLVRMRSVRFGPKCTCHPLVYKCWLACHTTQTDVERFPLDDQNL